MSFSDLFKIARDAEENANKMKFNYPKGHPLNLSELKLKETDSPCCCPFLDREYFDCKLKKTECCVEEEWDSTAIKDIENCPLKEYKEVVVRLEKQK